MTILDANVLLYAFDATAPQHARVRLWMEGLVDRQERLGITWLALWAFLRIATNPKLVTTTLPLDRAFAKVREILSLPRADLILPGARHAEILERVASDGQSTGPRLIDAVFAALALEHGATLASTDRDFARFPGLRWVNPLDASAK